MICSYLTEKWIKVLHAMLGEFKDYQLKDNLSLKLQDLYSEIERERSVNKIPGISIYDFLCEKENNNINEINLNLETIGLWSLDDDTVLLLYAIGAEVADFSCLGEGVRDYVESLWITMKDELKRRNVEPEFLCDLEESDI